MQGCDIVNNGEYAYYASSCSDPGTVINAEQNWWGVADSASIEAMVYHRHDYSSSPEVDYIPFAESPFHCVCGIWGDVTGDGNVNPQDVTFMVQYVYMTNDIRVQQPDCPLEAGDVNCDGKVNPQDVTYYVQYVYMTNDLFCDDPCAQ